MVFYTLFPGIYLSFIRTNALAWPEPDTNTQLHPLLINYCISGRSELLLEDTTYIYIKEKDISISRQSAQKEYIFPTKHYEGIKLYFDEELLKAESERLLGQFGIDFKALEKIYCTTGNTYIAQTQPEAELILNKIWTLFDRPSLFYMQIYVLELLTTLSKQALCRPTPYAFYTEIQVRAAKKAEQIVTGDIRKHYPIKKLAAQFSISETSLKNYFRGVYGQTISSYLRELRMKTASKLLSETKLPISEISAQVGYTNQGKFAAVFKKRFHLSPLEYRRFQNLEKY